MEQNNRSSEEQILQEAARLSQALDEFDAMSWGRIVEIADSLKGGTGNISETIAEHGNELKTIAEAGTMLQQRGLHIGERPESDEESDEGDDDDDDEDDDDSDEEQSAFSYQDSAVESKDAAASGLSTDPSATAPIVLPPNAFQSDGAEAPVAYEPVEPMVGIGTEDAVQQNDNATSVLDSLQPDQMRPASEAPTFQDGELPEWARRDGAENKQEAVDAFFQVDAGSADEGNVFIPRGETGAMPIVSAEAPVADGVDAYAEVDASAQPTIGAGLSPDFIAQFEQAVQAAKEGGDAEGPSLSAFIEQAKSMIGTTPTAGVAAGVAGAGIAASVAGQQTAQADEVVAESAQEAIDNLYTAEATEGTGEVPLVEPVPDLPNETLTAQETDDIIPDIPQAAEEVAEAPQSHDAPIIPFNIDAHYTAEPADPHETGEDATVLPLFEPKLEPEGDDPTVKQDAQGDVWAEDEQSETEAASKKKLSWRERRKLKKQEKAAAAAAAAAAAEEAKEAKEAKEEEAIPAPPAAEDLTDAVEAAEETVSEQAAEANAEVEATVAQEVATFRNIYTSRDGNMALYEDEDGHITAVNLNKLA